MQKMSVPKKKVINLTGYARIIKFMANLLYPQALVKLFRWLLVTDPPPTRHPPAEVETLGAGNTPLRTCMPAYRPAQWIENNRLKANHALNQLDRCVDGTCHDVKYSTTDTPKYFMCPHCTCPGKKWTK